MQKKSPMIAEMEAKSVIEATGFGRGNGGCLGAPFREVRCAYAKEDLFLVEARIQRVLS